MNKILNALFEIDKENISTKANQPKREDVNLEWELFHDIYEQLPQNKREAFLTYVRLRDAREEIEKRACYQHGFKTAIRLLNESLKG